MISGDPWTKQATDANNRPIPPEKQSFWFAVAIEKNAPGMSEMLGLMFKTAQAGYGQSPHIMAQINMGLAATAFSWKIADGDEMGANTTTGEQELRWKHGQGCWIAKFSTTLPIASAKFMGGVPTYCDPSEIKRGYYVTVPFSTAANGNMDHTAGVYLNPQTVCLVGFGPEIVSGPSLEQQLGAGPGAYMPAGMSQTPQLPSGTAPAPAPAAQAPSGIWPIQPHQPSGMPTPAPTPAPAAPGPQPQPSGMPTPAASGMPTATGSGGEPPAYGGYMAPPATGGGMPGA